MLNLDTENSVLNPSAIRAIKNTRLGELKRIFGTYFGFTTATELANYFALSQVIGRRRESVPPPANTSAGVLSARRDLIVRVHPDLKQVFEILLDNGGGAKKVLPIGEDNTAIINQLVALLQGVDSQSLESKRYIISRCAKIHCSNSINLSSPSQEKLVGTPTQPPRNQVIFKTLDSALPTNSNEDSSFRNRIAVIRADHPLLIPGEKNAEFLSVFFNGMPTLEMTRATPVMNVKFYSSRQVFEDNKLAAITLQKFVEGSRRIDPTEENLPIRAIGLASQVLTGSVPGQLPTAREFSNYTVTGLELFRAPQTLVNQESTKNRENYLAPVIDPMRPLASIKSFNMDIKSSYGLQGTRTATLEIVLHDRSRMGEFADFIKPDRYGETFIEVEYGWLHPDPLGENPYADLLNLSRVISHFSIITSNFNFDEVGQVNITLNLQGRGSSEISELSIVGANAAGRIQNQIKTVRQLSETINRLSSLVFPPPPENQSGNNQRRTEVRGTQGLNAASDATNNLLLSREVISSMRELQDELNRRASSSNQSRRDAAQTLQRAIRDLIAPGNSTRTDLGRSASGPQRGSALSNVSRTLNQEIREVLNNINQESSISEERYKDSFLETINGDVWRFLTENNNLTATRGAASRAEIPEGQLPDTGNNAASAGPGVPVDAFAAGKDIVSLGTLVAAFVGKPLASLKNSNGDQQFEEIQLYFYNFNNRAGIMSHCNISQFPVQTQYFVREYGRLRMESVSRAVNMSVSEFMNFLSTKIVDDVLNPAYGIKSLYRVENTGEVRARDRVNGKSFDEAMIEKMLRYNIGRHPDFVPPQLTFEMEATEPIVNERPLPGKSILKVHIYDKACSPNSSFRELLTLGTNNVMGTLSAYPGDQAQQQTTEIQAQTVGENISVLRENWRQLHAEVVNRCLADGLIQILPPPPSGPRSQEQQQYFRFSGGAQQLKEFVMKGVPHIIYGAMGTTIRSSTVGSMSDPNLNSINILRSLNASPIQPNGEQIGGVPLSVYPVEVSLTSLGCPFLYNLGQEIFIDYNTNTSIDNIYYITGLQHKIEAGTFETSIKLTAVDAFGQYRNLVGQLNTAERTLSAIPGILANSPTSQRTTS